MQRRDLVARGLAHYWRTHLAVMAGVAVAVSVLTGALLVGDSVRGSLRDLVLGRLGRTDQVVASAGFFREALAGDMRRDPRFAPALVDIAPLVVARALVTDQSSGRRAGQVAVYGVDDRFWRFHGVDVTGPQDREAFVSPALAAQLGPAQAEASILVRLQRPTDVPLESLHGRRDDVGRTLRLTVSGVLPASSLGEFSLEPQQGEVSAVFVPLSRLQRELDVEGRVNTLLVSVVPGGAAGAEATLQQLVRTHTTLEDLGLDVSRRSLDGIVWLTSDSGLLTDQQIQAADRAREPGTAGFGAFAYLANSLRIGAREVPYSLVVAHGGREPRFRTLDAAAGDVRPPIILNRWAADDLRARTGDTLLLEYYVWEDPGRLQTRSTEFRVVGTVPVEERDRDLVPTYPGISDSPTLDAWDPPFPIDLRRIRRVDEEYWERYRATPKAYIPLAVGQRLWGSRHGAMTSFGVTRQDAAPLAARLRTELDPLTAGLAVREVRAASLGASRGATDFGEYFVYFSFFLVVAALILASLFFKLGVEQRVREVGLLRAVGFGPAEVRRLFLGEGLLLAGAGSAIGVVGAIGYASLLMYGLRTWWVDAVGTTALALHVTPVSLAAGASGGMVVAAGCIWWTLRSLGRISERSLLAGEIGLEVRREPTPPEKKWGGGGGSPPPPETWGGPAPPDLGCGT